MRGRLLAGAVCAALAATLLTPAPAGAAHADCGTGQDTPPAIHLGTNGTCSGSLRTDYSEPFYDTSDEYTYDATLDDRVQISFSTSAPCLEAPGSNAPFLATSTGVHTAVVQVESGGWEGGCAWDPRDHNSYAIGVLVTPNDRPSVPSVSGPSTAYPGHLAPFDVSATDVDWNLARLGVRVGAGVIQWTETTGAATLGVRVDRTETLTFYAEDTFGARSQVSRTLTAVQNDCGDTGGDVTTVARPFPFACAGHLSLGMSDTSDEYAFDVPGGTPRIAVRYAQGEGTLSTRLTLRDPSGAVAAETTDDAMFVPASAGTWRLTAARTGGFGGYALDVAPIGAPAPPSLSAAVSPSAIHQGEAVTATFSATDPNGEAVHFEVDWGDGTVERFPASGRLATPASGSLSHRYVAASTSARPVVRAVNEEALTDSRSFTVAIRLHDDCGFGADAPSTRTGAGLRDAAASCEGELGYRLPDAIGTTDDADVFRLRLTRTSEVSAGLIAGAPLQARLFLEIATVRVGLGETVGVVLPAGTYYLVAQRTSGVGAYYLGVHVRPVW